MNAPGPAAPGPRRALFLASALALFLELAMIRWVAACVPAVAFFANFVLVAAFGGLALGCLRARTAPRPVASVAWLTTAMAATAAARIAYDWGRLPGNRGLYHLGVSSPEVIYFGTVPLGRERDLALAIPSELALAVVFALLVGVFVRIGHVVGHAFDGVGAPSRAYATNLAGSLAGIAAFALVSALSLPPLGWFVPATAVLALLVWPHARSVAARAGVVTGAALTVIAVALADTAPDPAHTIWSPYYRIDYAAPPNEPGTVHVDVNGLSHQIMRPLADSGRYRIPHTLAKEAGMGPRRRVLVIGAGTGNDVARALDEGAEHVDAVEIDPEIAALGRLLHPEHPYADPRVHLTIDDGRAWLDRTNERYDLIVYALVDSLTLHSSYGSVRLENFLFTAEAIARVRDHLAPGGIFAAYNTYREDWLIVRLERLLAQAFGTPPVVIALPPRPEITDRDPAPGTAPEAKHALLVAGATDPIRESLARRAHEPGAYVPSRVRATEAQPLPTDDWPFVYLRRAVVPAHNARMWLILAVLGIGVAWRSAPRGALRSWDAADLHFVALGAGFLLLETAGVVRLAALFGSTWVTSSVAFAAILAMAGAANAAATAWPRVPTWVSYLGLLAALGVFAAVPSSALASLAFGPRLVAAGCWLALPVLCSGHIFARSLAASATPSRALGANIAGAVVGAALESASLVIGYRSLVAVIGVCYGLSWLALARARRGATAGV